MSDPFYRTETWRRLRQAALQRDGWRCTTPGCGSTKGLTVDHILSRRAGGPDTLANLRTLCGDCDRSVKEGASGQRRGGGVPRARGCYADGTPRDHLHWWNAAAPKKARNLSELGRETDPGPRNRVSFPSGKTGGG